MKRASPVSVIAAASIILLGAAPSLGDEAGDNESAANVHNKLYGGISKFAVLNEDVQSNIGIRCTTAGDNGFRVAAVNSGSEAEKNGIQPGDLVLNAQVNKNDVVLSLERGDRIFYLKLKQTSQDKSSSPLTPMEAKTDTMPTKTFPLQAEKSNA